MNVNAFERELRSLIRGGVSFDEVTRGIYATDASIYQLMPVAVVEPKDEEDVRAAVTTAANHGVSILPRGGGTSLNGQGCGRAMILDFTRYMNRVLELNTAEKWVRVQPGIVLDVLNAQLAEQGLQFAPDPATSSRATIGGMMGNNSAGTKSLLFGMTRDHVLRGRVMLSDATVLQLEELSAEAYAHKCGSKESREGEIYRGFKEIVEQNRDAIVKAYPKVMRRVQGYNLDLFTASDSWNLMKLIIGSEGTLGIFLESTLKLVPLPKSKVLCTVHFSDLLQAIRTVSPILQHGPSAVEIMDDDIIVRARENLSIRPLTQFIEGDPKAVLIVEFFGESADDALDKAHVCVEDLKEKKLGYAWPIITEAAEQAKVWAVRKNGLGLMLGMKSERKPLPIVEDGCVPIEVLPEYIDNMLKFCRDRGVPVAMYAHASVGVIHVRPALSLKSSEDIAHMKAIAEHACKLIKGYGGSLSGEHGDGRVRSPFLKTFFGQDVYGLFRKVKKLFDPIGLMNPGIIVDPNPIDQDLRYGLDYDTPVIPTLYHFREDGSFAAAVEMCTGVGDCRQRLSGTMCPSYRVTLDETKSTRGFANAMRLAMTGQFEYETMHGRRLYELLDSCISCKACKSECPSNVDLSRIKSEFLQMYNDANGAPKSARFMVRYLDWASKRSGFMASCKSSILRSWPGKIMLQQCAGIDSRRRLPKLASEKISESITQTPLEDSAERPVVLFDDTYMNSFEPGVGVSAARLLQSCGYKVILANAGCCQRYRISRGFLREAKILGEKTLRNLDRHIQQGLNILVCEPGCCSALVDDLPDLVDDEELGGRIREHVMMIDTFLAREHREGKLSVDFVSPHSSVLVQGHCHQKALFGTSSMKYLLDLVPGTVVEELDAGCCGMGDLYGYEKGHYEFSMQIGEDRLFPRIRSRENDTAVVACGFNCRTQIHDATGVRPMHWVQAIRGKTNGA